MRKLIVAFVIVIGWVDFACAQQPSFDCRLARSPSEIAICSDAHLSELDRINGVAFDVGRRRPGNHDLVVAVQTLLLARIACQSDRICILDSLVETLQLYQRWNIPIVIPDWVSQYRSELAGGPAVQGYSQSHLPDVGAAPPLSPPVGGPGATNVALLNDGGTFVVPVTINDQLTLKFVVDSGASDVSIPADVVMTLVRTGTITNSDFLGEETYQMADGSTVPSQRFVIRSLKVGDKILRDVTGSIASVKGNPLLGQSFLSRFKSWSIDNQREVLILD